MKKELPRGTQQNPADLTPTKHVPPHPESLYMSLSDKEYSSLRNGMLNLEADTESAILQITDALQFTFGTGDQTEKLVDRLICAKKLLNKSLHRIRDWRVFLSPSSDAYCTPSGTTVIGGGLQCQKE